METHAILEWHDSSGLRARFCKQWGSPAHQLGRIVDWLTMCADQGVATSCGRSGTACFDSPTYVRSASTHRAANERRPVCATRYSQREGWIG
jgi:hypothetical protein